MDLLFFRFISTQRRAANKSINETSKQSATREISRSVKLLAANFCDTAEVVNQGSGQAQWVTWFNFSSRSTFLAVTSRFLSHTENYIPSYETNNFHVNLQ